MLETKRINHRRASMNKADIITRLRDSKKAHMSWVTHAHALVEGMDVAADKVPVHGTECGFGCWYYGEGQLLSQLNGFRKVEDPHLKLHDIYLIIHKHLAVRSQEDTTSALGRLFGAGKKLEADKAEADARARELFTQLKMVSKEVSAHLDDMENQLIGMDEAAFGKLLSAQGIGADQQNVVRLKSASQ
jgi:hypothetical protein